MSSKKKKKKVMNAVVAKQTKKKKVMNGVAVVVEETKQLVHCVLCSLQSVKSVKSIVDCRCSGAVSGRGRRCPGRACWATSASASNGCGPRSSFARRRPCCQGHSSLTGGDVSNGEWTRSSPGSAVRSPSDSQWGSDHVARRVP